MAKGRVAALTTLWRAVRASRRPGAPGIGAQLAAAPRMLGASLSGRYPHLARGRMALAVLGILYIISPIDFIPEAAFLIFGLGDDALVTAWVVGAVLSETERYLQWEALQRRVVVGEVVR
jgi:uncharacterized membrane protein YkvA (DUF1232 family)